MRDYLLSPPQVRALLRAQRPLLPLNLCLAAATLLIHFGGLR
jgi:hypothetical protein